MITTSFIPLKPTLPSDFHPFVPVVPVVSVVPVPRYPHRRVVQKFSRSYEITTIPRSINSGINRSTGLYTGRMAAGNVRRARQFEFPRRRQGRGSPRHPSVWVVLHGAPASTLPAHRCLHASMPPSEHVLIRAVIRRLT